MLRMTLIVLFRLLHIYIYIHTIIPSNLYKLSLILKDIEEGHLLIENFVNIFCVTSLSVSLHDLLGVYVVNYVCLYSEIIR